MFSVVESSFTTCNYYSFIFYYRLTGCQVFGGDEFNEVINKNEKCIINWQFEKINIFLSEESVDLLKRMLEKDPNKRITIS